MGLAALSSSSDMHPRTTRPPTLPTPTHPPYPQVGQRVFAIGNPFGLDQTLTQARG